VAKARRKGKEGNARKGDRYQKGKKTKRRRVLAFRGGKHPNTRVDFGITHDVKGKRNKTREKEWRGEGGRV